MNILIINAGSSTLKCQLIDMSSEKVLAKAACERIGIGASLFKYETIDGKVKKYEMDIESHKEAFSLLIDEMVASDVGVIKSLDEIDAVGHRISHGGEELAESFMINDETIRIVEKNAVLAPLHNSANLVGIYACRELMPNTLMVGMPDTAFHHTIPEHAYIYPIPYEYYEKHKIRKYGFHGMSHQYVSMKAAEITGKPYDSLKIVSCHLGNGSSITAIKNGESIENTMGFTPLDGIAMGTRSGAIDPAIVLFLQEAENKSIAEMNDILNKKSGILGMSGVSSDFRDLIEASEKGNKRAQMAIDIYAYKVNKCIGEYAAAMGGIDILIFTAGIGENSVDIRKKSVKGLEFLGIEIDADKNKNGKKEVNISKEGSRVTTLVVETNEEIVIARETKKLIYA